LALATVLLALAAGVLYAREPQPACPPAAVTATGPSGEVTATHPAGATPDPAALEVRDLGARASAGPRLPLPPGAVGVPIRLAEPAALAVVRPGARVDLLAVPAAGGSARPTEPALVAARALVLDVVTAEAAVDVSTALYLALPPEQAHRAVGMPDSTRFAIIVRE
jgi:hypothetical protein